MLCSKCFFFFVSKGNGSDHKGEKPDLREILSAALQRQVEMNILVLKCEECFSKQLANLIGAFRSEDKDDYEFSVPSTCTSKNVSL